MNGFTITATRASGQLQPVRIKDPAFDLVCRQALAFACNAAIHGCPIGDALPPKWVDIHDEAGHLFLRIVVDETLKPVAEPGA